MNILWLINIALPEASILLNEIPTPFGGWLVNASQQLSKEEGTSLSIAFPKRNRVDIQCLRGSQIDYYVFPAINAKSIKKSDDNIHLSKILDLAKPDIVHIFGTEYAHARAMVNQCSKQNIKAVISIQGLVSVIANHYLAGIPCNVQSRFTVRDWVKLDNLKYQQRKFAERGLMEVEALQKVEHVIGRTTWDRACASQINPKARYHFCNETLREEFYKHIWNINQCERYSIFVSQGAYPIKGLHYLLEAMPLILERFPDTKLYIAGGDPTRSDTWKSKLKRSSYGKYIKELISKNRLEEHIEFTGILDEEKMRERYLKSHVFVSSSNIENESNSLSEAKILGVPAVASYVGGVTDRIQHGVDGYFYQHDAPYMLAHYVCEIFGNDELALKLSANARKHAMVTHDREKNTITLIEIYNTILDSKKIQ